MLVNSFEETGTTLVFKDDPSLRLVMKLGVLIFMMLALGIGETSKLFAYEEQQKLPTLKEAIGSKVDLYGNLAIGQKNGLSY